MDLKSERHSEADVFRRLDDVAREDRRRRFRETDMAQRLETAFELGDLSRELRAGVERSQ